jgi:signal transduction histidine kinase
MPTVDRMTTMPADVRYQAPLVRVARQLGIDSLYVLVGFPIAVASFTVLITGLSVAGGMLITFVGIPLLTATLWAARGFAELERLRMAPVLRRPYARGVYRRSRRDGIRWMVEPIIDGQYWLDMVHGIAVFVISTVTWSIAVTWWSAALAGTFYGAYDWALPHPKGNGDPSVLLGMGDSAQARIVLNTAAGIFFLLTLPLVMRGCALGQAYLGQAMLNGLATMRERITGLERQTEHALAQTETARAQTAAAVSAEATALRRLERDIHDGPQQRLVRLAMDLGRAQQQLDHDPQAARQTVGEALLQTRETLDELRALSRGIAPPVLADRGLAAAIAALAGRSMVPVELAVDEPGRLDTGVENTAYFVVAEALTNVAKHSHAQECRVTLVRHNGHLTVTVTDDGVGGASLAKGHGLAGLDDRVRAAGGMLAVFSPMGGPTTVTADLPCT